MGYEGKERSRYNCNSKCEQDDRSRSEVDEYGCMSDEFYDASNSRSCHKCFPSGHETCNYHLKQHWEDASRQKCNVKCNNGCVDYLGIAIGVPVGLIVIFGNCLFFTTSKWQQGPDMATPGQEGFFWSGRWKTLRSFTILQCPFEIIMIFLGFVTTGPLVFGGAPPLLSLIGLSIIACKCCCTENGGRGMAIAYIVLNSIALIGSVAYFCIMDYIIYWCTAFAHEQLYTIPSRDETYRFWQDEIKGVHDDWPDKWLSKWLQLKPAYGGIGRPLGAYRQMQKDRVEYGGGQEGFDKVLQNIVDGKYDERDWRGTTPREIERTEIIADIAKRSEEKPFGSWQPFESDKDKKEREMFARGPTGIVDDPRAIGPLDVENLRSPTTRKSSTLTSSDDFIKDA